LAVVARIRGSVSEGLLRGAIAKVRQLHSHLRVRIVEYEDGDPWFTSGDVGGSRWRS
jgi:hypothetical protein